MSTLVNKKNPPAFGTGTMIMAFLAITGLLLVVYRWFTGLGTTTGLTDGRGWGLWISFDVFCGIALAAGAFCVAGTVYILHLKEFYPILRPTVLTGFLGYALAAFAISVDLGFPYRIWHMIIYWNVHSPLFEIGWCVMIYATVLALELSPMVFERFNMKTPLKMIRAITIPLVILGIVLSTMHQSSLGTLFVLMPYRIHPLWYSYNSAGAVLCISHCCRLSHGFIRINFELLRNESQTRDPFIGQNRKNNSDYIGNLSGTKSWRYDHQQRPGVLVQRR